MQSIEQRTVDLAEHWLRSRGVDTWEIAELVHQMQHAYYDELSIEECEMSVRKVLSKREVLNTILTGIQLDMLAEQNKLMQPLQRIIAEDEGLYGCDEILALSIVNVYGSIGMTNFGYIDKVKPGVLSYLNDKDANGGCVHTFLDDIIGAITAAACSRIAHTRGTMFKGDR